MYINMKLKMSSGGVLPRKIGRAAGPGGEHGEPALERLGPRADSAASPARLIQAGYPRWGGMYEAEI
jgi:hypothetical protein